MIRAAHAAYVLDASVAAKWFTPHEESDRHKAIAVRSLHQTGRCRLVLPEFALLEILNAIRYSAGAEEADATRALDLLERLHLELVPLGWELLRKAASIAWASRVTLYDAAYVALAVQRAIPLLTADDTLIRNMKGHSSVVRLREMEFR